jgi:hypothetical protein
MSSFASKELPSESYLREIEAFADQISDPVEKLQFLKLAINEYQDKTRVDKSGRVSCSINEIAGSQANEQNHAFHQDTEHLETDLITVFRTSENRGKGFRVSRYLLGLGLFLALFCGWLMLVFPFNGISRNIRKGYPQPIKEHYVSHAVHYPPPEQVTIGELHPAINDVQKEDTSQIIPRYLDKLIWLIDKTEDAEYYSNRLKIHTTHTIENIPRGYSFIKILLSGRKKEIIQTK